MNKFLKQKEGITLIALVITIIILLILAGVAINILIGQDGLIERTTNAVKEYEIESAKEKLELLKAPIILDEKTVNLDNYLQKLNTVETEYKLSDIKQIDEKYATVIVDGKYKFLIEDEQNGNVKITYDGEVNGTGPITPNVGELELSATSGTITYPTAETFTVTKNTSGGTLSVTSSNENIATVSINENTVTVTPGTTAGTATITVTSAATSNYEEQTATYIATVENGTIEIEATAYTGIYDGKAHDAVTSVSTTPTGTTLRYKLNDGDWQDTIPQITNASEEYTIVIEASKEGYTKKTKTITVTIGKAETQNGNLVLSATSGTITYPTAETFTVTKNTSGGTLSVTSSNENIATVSINENTVTVTPGTTAGTATITVTSAATSNYEEQTATYIATVENGTIEIEATAYKGIYDGKAHDALTQVSTTPTGTTLKYKLNNGDWQDTIPQITNASEEYTIVIEASKEGYVKKIKTITVTIGKAETQNGNLTLSATSGIVTYPDVTTFEVTKNVSGGTLSVTSSNTEVAKTTISGTTVTIIPNALTEDGQTATITVTSAATSNYEEQTATYIATVNRGIIEIEATTYIGNYDEKAHDAVTSVSTTPTETTLRYKLDSGNWQDTIPQVINEGKYTISIEASKVGYVTKVLTISAEVKEYIVPYDNPYIPRGFSHKEGTWNDGFTIINDSNGNEFVWVPCVLDQNKVREGHTVVTFKKYLPTVNDSSDPLYKYNSDNYQLEDVGETPAEIEISVGKYGGFYIAKYEAGVPVDRTGKEISDSNATTSEIPRSVAGATTWTRMSRDEMMIVSEAMIKETETGAKSALISGACWDTTMQWIVNASDNKDYEPNLDYDINSKGKGVYKTGTESASKVKTGEYGVNNIYDMAGNVYEYTSENGKESTTYYPMGRGGGVSVKADTHPTARRYDIHSFAPQYRGFRVVMYKLNEESGPHTHKGSSEIGDGCYSKVVYHTHDSECNPQKCTGKFTLTAGSHYEHKCNKCKRTITNYQLADKAGNIGDVCTSCYGSTCGITIYECGKTEDDIDRYELNCGF